MNLETFGRTKKEKNVIKIDMIAIRIKDWDLNSNNVSYWFERIPPIKLTDEKNVHMKLWLQHLSFHVKSSNQSESNRPLLHFSEEGGNYDTKKSAKWKEYENLIPSIILRQQG